jgi:hypothetical protein
MMHGHEKSDPAIVAKKPANNAGHPAAERVERRAGTEGNAGSAAPRDRRRSAGRCWPEGVRSPTPAPSPLARRNDPVFQDTV